MVFDSGAGNEMFRELPRFVKSYRHWIVGRSKGAVPQRAA
jgi:hypothetical protein